MMLQMTGIISLFDGISDKLHQNSSVPDATADTPYLVFWMVFPMKCPNSSAMMLQMTRVISFLNGIAINLTKTSHRGLDGRQSKIAARV